MDMIKTTIVASLAIIMMVTAVLMLTRSASGEYPGASCTCTIQHLDSYGDVMSEQVQELRVQMTGGMSDSDCSTRCADMYSDPNQRVSGVATQ